MCASVGYIRPSCHHYSQPPLASLIYIWGRSRWTLWKVTFPYIESRGSGIGDQVSSCQIVTKENITHTHCVTSVNEPTLKLIHPCQLRRYNALESGSFGHRDVYILYIFWRWTCALCSSQSTGLLLRCKLSGSINKVKQKGHTTRNQRETLRVSGELES